MDETPDQILARLQRHAESIRRAAGPGSAPAAPSRSEPQSVNPSASGTGLPSRSLLKSSGVPGNPAPAPVPGAPATQIVHWGGERAADLIPVEVAHHPRFGLVLRTIAGQALAVFCCVLALVLSIKLSVIAALIVVAILAGAGAIATLRRVPFSGWCTLGIVIGWALGRFS